MVDRVAELEETVRRRSRGRLDLLAFSISPDGHWAATLLRARATGYWLESLYEYDNDRWTEVTTSNGGLAYTATGENDEGDPIGALRYYGEAPADSVTATIRWRETLHEVPVQNNHFAFAVWDATEHEIDRLAATGFAGAEPLEPKVVSFQ